jgi:formyl-CoA transferase/CoA:oxalate CoA-transferase
VIDHPAAGRLEYPGAPYRLLGTPWELRRAAPTLGEHNDEILQGLGIAAAERAELRAAGAI